MTRVKLSVRAPYELRMGKWVQPLTDSEAYLLWHLMSHHRTTSRNAARAVWGMEHNWPMAWRNGLAVRYAALRKKLRPFGWDVRCDGIGSIRRTYVLQHWEGEEVLAA